MAMYKSVPCSVYNAPNGEQTEDDIEKIKMLNSLSWTSDSTQAPSEQESVLPLLSFSPTTEKVAGIAAEWEDSKPMPENDTHVWTVPTHLGSPDGSNGGFYGVMRRTRNLRASIVGDLFSTSTRCNAGDVNALQSALASLESISRPPASQADGDDSHWLVADSTTTVTVRLDYEKNELFRDIRFLVDGESALLETLRCQHAKLVANNTGWLEAKLPSWEDSIQRAVTTLRAASAVGHDSGRSRSPPFRNFITDRDGTTNNYCDRYASCVQSAYNAVWIAEFARKCTETTVLLTAAPLGGRPSAEGLLELCTMPEGYVTCAGSRGREFFDYSRNQVLEVESLPASAHELLEDLHTRLVVLCRRPGNRKFLGVGSGLQYKCGELNIACNDPSKSISYSESRRFNSEVQSLIKLIDPNGTLLDVRDTGTDIEIAPRRENGHASFDKSHGVMALDHRLGLNLADGPSLICGDTPSDLPMVKAAVQLMTKKCLDLGATKATMPAAKLAVLFVVSPEQHARTPNFATEVRTICSESGAHCAILPSPDVLGAALAQFTREVASGSTIAGAVGRSTSIPDQARIPCTL